MNEFFIRLVHDTLWSGMQFNSIKVRQTDESVRVGDSFHLRGNSIWRVSEVLSNLKSRDVSRGVIPCFPSH